ncbi:MAG: ankyrin repeat domain-containing protein [Tatlockia sp.]|nr:ankyrin repeat domain-containing protein [Tatlockia sp.]
MIDKDEFIAVESKIAFYNTPFHDACAAGKLDECERLHTKNPNYLNQLHPEFNSTGLAFAVQSNHISIVKWLLQNKASLYCEDEIRNYYSNFGDQLIDNPLKPSNGSYLTPFSFCKNAEIFSLLYEAIGHTTFNYPQLIVISCEMIISLLNQDQKNLERAKTLLKNIQLIVKNTQFFNDKSVKALNAAAKSFFDAKAYTEAHHCCQLIEALLITKYEDQVLLNESSVELIHSCLTYNYRAILREQEDTSTTNSTFVDQFSNFSASSFKEDYRFEAEECY